MKKIILKYPLLLASAWTVIIFILCATPGHYIPSANWLDLLSIDKFVHACMFFVLSTLFFFSATKYKKSITVFITAFFACVLYGGLLELMQAKYFSHRSGDWLDFIANSFGCVMAALFSRKIAKLFKNVPA